MRAVTLLVLIVLFQTTVCCADFKTPLLRLNTVMHSGDIKAVAIDSAENLLLSCSIDKTARLWDLHSGDLLRVFRPPITSDNVGMLYSCALSPDGRFAVVGGWTESKSIYVFDTSDCSILYIIKDLPNVVSSIVFSADGTKLFIGFVGSSGLRIYDTNDWSSFVNLDRFRDSVYTFDISTCGWIVVGCDDGTIRLYNAERERLASIMLPGGAQPRSLAFDPDGDRIAVGFGNKPWVLVLDAELQEILCEPDISGATAPDSLLYEVCWSADGTELYAAGHLNKPDIRDRGYVIRRWADGGSGHYQDLPVAGNSIVDLISLRDGSLLWASTGPDWGILRFPEQPYLIRSSEHIKFEDAIKGHLRSNSTGDMVVFTGSNGTQYNFNVKSRLLASDPMALDTYTDDAAGLKIEDWVFSPAPLLNGDKLNFLETGEYSNCLDIGTKDSLIVFGTSWSLYCLDQEGNQKWKVPTQAAVFAVKVAEAGQVVIGAFSDGTLRWYDLVNGRLLLSLFLHSDGTRWVLFSPSGYYDCALRSEDLIGWQVNIGLDQAAEFYPVARFREQYYRPDIIDLMLFTRDEQTAIQTANQISGEATAKDIESILPPTIRIISPQTKSTFSSSEIKITYRLTLPNGVPVTSLRVQESGRFYMQYDNLNLSGGIGSLILTLPERDLSLGLIAEDKDGNVSPMDTINIVWKGVTTDVTPREPVKPRLFVLAIGVSDYLLDGHDLKFASKDAEDFASVVGSQSGKLYSKAYIKLLKDSTAMKDSIMAGMDWLRENCLASDLAMIFLSGHGFSDSVGRFYYVPVTGDVRYLRKTCVPFFEFVSTLAEIRGRVIMFIDACHSGGINFADAPPNITRLLNTVSDDDVGVAIFSSCESRQVSFEKPVWQNGAFTKALVEGLMGGADQFKKNNMVTWKELDLYISDRVPELTSEQGLVQTPVILVPRCLPNFDIIQIDQR
jgi:WD40 repeat protein